MDPDELYQLVKHQPFEPFRLHVSDGSMYEVRYPDQIMIGKRACHVGIRRERSRPFGRIAIVSNNHISRIEPMNGHPRKRRSRKQQ